MIGTWLFLMSLLFQILLTTRISRLGVKSSRNCLPDWYEEIEDMVCEGEKVWVRVKSTGTHSGDWTLFGVSLPATGNKIVMRMVFFFRVVDGKLVETGELDDQLDFFDKLGLIEYTEKGKRLFSEEAT
jgi:C-1 hydroxylase